ncbi:hypothetical protein M378DRAFT_183671 [Amanita muscaria Koide BX008]|uniref:HSP90-domain-containing protein n=1 Tax=Amanita muscaria (strain Koide BX008) TaxID=946122 RepID=A0A0C2X6Y4_AMAMK|nr:hypothetical protein M378DRAFT_183671 [Amanita muscaria Koide BX008]
MSVPLSAPLPGLPQGWVEHIGPNGQSYYYNAFTKQSTYLRPLTALPLPGTAQIAGKKEKSLYKTPIPGTDWLRVRTTEGNIFYSNKARKESVWVVPDEIKKELEQLEEEESLKENMLRVDSNPQQAQRQSEEVEIERIRNEVQELVKRKAEEGVPIDELIVTKKPRTDDGGSEEASEGGASSEEEAGWQKEVAEKLDAKTEEKIAEERRSDEAKHEEEENVSSNSGTAHQRQKLPPQLHIPERVDLSIEEAKALFKTLLRDKDVNPLHPWDKSLPLFISDPRYVLLPSVAARREAFDDYCRERARELKEASIKKEIFDPKEEFEKLLAGEVKSTRTSWTDFRRAWKKDRRFYGWGRDEREREKRFREFVKELSEKKRAAAEKAEADFIALLRERIEPNEELVWKDVKRGLYDDLRYDAVGSSSLREELFSTFLKGKAKYAPETIGVGNASQRGGEDEKRTRKEQSLKEREEKVRAERSRLDAQIERSKQDLGKEEGARLFRTLLTDAIRDPQTWEAAFPQLKTDPRFINSALTSNHQLQLFRTHVDHLQDKHINNLHTLFQTHTRSLATSFTELPVSLLLTSLPATKLGYNITDLEREYSKWQRERFQESRRAFDEMLSENSFVEFWGRLGKIGGEGVNGFVKAEDMGEDEGEAGGGTVDMKSLAKNIDICDMEKVIKNDKRYMAFDHIPERREQWIRVPQDGTLRVKQDYQSDVARMRKIVINREIFLRELISNANDALEKLRLVSLTNKSAWDGVDPLNITIKAVKDEDGKGGRVIITDTGIGMSADELQTNLGTLARSGTSDFLAQAENQEAVGTSNLIGAFGLGFYSSFLVSDRVEVASIPIQSDKVPNPVQHIFSSAAEDSTFEVFPDPRGNTLVRGTEITLYLKKDSLEYLEQNNLEDLVDKHSSYSSTFPIYLRTRKTKEVPDEDAKPEVEETTVKSADSSDKAGRDEEEAVIEDISPESEDKETTKKTKMVEVEEWLQLNSQPPLWTRDPKSVSDEEYKSFYRSFFKDFSEPLAWSHFTADSESGVSFKAMIFLPQKIEEAFWTNPLLWKPVDIKLMVKRVFITSDFGDDSLPKWASWVKVVVDAEDLALNVSRENLQSSRFLKQMRSIILKRLIQLFSKIAEEDPEKLKRVQEAYNTIFKLGAVEDAKHRDRLVPLIQFATNQRNATSLNEYLENKKQGQKQIFHIAEVGKTPEDLAQSVFIEKLHARGYEVLLLTEPLDEILVQNIRHWKKVPFQDVAKAGLKFGDEDADTTEEEEQKALDERYKPLLDWLKEQSVGLVRDVLLSTRLVKSPCAIVADSYGYTANVQRMMNAANAKMNKNEAMHELALKAKVLEINPRSPLIEGLLRRIEGLPAETEERDESAEAEIKEVTAILIDSALVRSGFEVRNSNEFFTRMDRVLRRSLGVSETAPTDETVKPAPPVDPELPSDEEVEAPPIVFKDKLEDMPEDDDKPQVILPDHLKDKLQIDIEEMTDDEPLGYEHVEL